MLSGVILLAKIIRQLLHICRYILDKQVIIGNMKILFKLGIKS